MVVRRDKKSRKYRGFRTHGYGSVGQHRKSGSRGGRGAVGMHKHKWSWTVKYAPDWYGKHGFVPPKRGPLRYKVINLNQLNELIEKLLKESKITYENDVMIVDLKQFEIDKILGEGNISYKVKVLVNSASENAIRKIKEVGGEVVITR